MKQENAVKSRYASAAEVQEQALCCPVDYNPEYLKVIPQEVIDKDYGCGDPSQWLKLGETVLDLGSGTGKICFIASQVVGEKGKVIGVDMTDSMLEVAHRNAPIVADAIGYANVEFVKGRIQDLALNLDDLEQVLSATPIHSADDWVELEAATEKLRKEKPMIPSESVDVVVSNCVLNLVDPDLKPQLFQEIFRVLKNGGRAVISDIVSDEDVPEAMQKDEYLWSGCISGALSEEAFIKAFEEVGFYGVQMVKYESEPWQTVDGIEFRSVTIEAFKGKEGPCLDRNQAVIYNGPFKKVLDDDGHSFERGVRYAVCDKTYQIYSKAPYAGSFEIIDPITPIPLELSTDFNCKANARRPAQETKGQDYNATTEASNCCEPSQDGTSCC